MADVNLYLTDDSGRRLETLNQATTFEGSKGVNGIGDIWLELPQDTFAFAQMMGVEVLKPDRIIQLWYGGRLWNSYLLLKWEHAYSDDGRNILLVGGYDMNHLLWRRIVAAKEGEAQAAFTATAADDMMKAVVTDAMQDDADPVPEAGTRAWADLSVAANTTAGPVLTKALPFEKLLTLSGVGVLPDISKASRVEGTETFFEIAPSSISASAVAYQFRTHTGQPGRDLTTGWGRVVFDANAGTLTDARLVYDYSTSENYLYIRGQGDKSDETVDQVYDATGYNRSRWGRCEGVMNAGGKEDAELEAIGQAELTARGPVVTLRGIPVSTEQQAFGIHYDVGDRVLAKGWGYQSDAIVWEGRIGKNEDGSLYTAARLEFRDA